MGRYLGDVFLWSLLLGVCSVTKSIRVHHIPSLVVTKENIKNFLFDRRSAVRSLREIVIGRNASAPCGCPPKVPPT